MFERMDHTAKVCLVAGINLSLAGARHYVDMLAPLLSPLSTAIQIAIGAYSLYHIFFLRSDRERQDRIDRNRRNDRLDRQDRVDRLRVRRRIKKSSGH
jgi:uncharacterized membrane protein YuzA (DUF378 family)